MLAEDLLEKRDAPATPRSSSATLRQLTRYPWVLNPAEASDAGANVRRMHKKAVEYLGRVIDEHPSTPWAWLATKELEEPLGWAWSESTAPVPPTASQAGRNRPQFAPEEVERQRRLRERNKRREATRPQL